MSISEIVNYVNRTPHNTNPNVIASMVQGANEQAVYESVEKLKQDGGVGYTEPAKAFTCDGNPNGENVYNNVYRITSKVLDLTTVTSFTFVNGGQSITMTKEEFIGMGGQVTSEDIGADDMGWLAYTIPTDGDKPIGTYVWCDENGYVSRIEFADTVHRIDGKYLPEGGVGYTGKGKVLWSETLPEGHATMQRRVFNFAAGQKYIVTYNGIEYPVTVVYNEVVDGVFGLGNLGAMNDGEIFPVTDEPFVIIEMYDEGEWGTMIGSTEGATACTITVSEAETIHKINPVYLPMVEITSAVMIDPSVSVPLTAEESAQLESYAKAGFPVVIKFKMSSDDGVEATMSGYFTLSSMSMGDHHAHVYTCGFGSDVFGFISDDKGQWYMGD